MAWPRFVLLCLHGCATVAVGLGTVAPLDARLAWPVLAVSSIVTGAAHRGSRAMRIVLFGVLPVAAWLTGVSAAWWAVFGPLQVLSLGLDRRDTPALGMACATASAACGIMLAQYTDLGARMAELAAGASPFRSATEVGPSVLGLSGWVGLAVGIGAHAALQRRTGWWRYASLALSVVAAAAITRLLSVSFDGEAWREAPGRALACIHAAGALAVLLLGAPLLRARDGDRGRWRAPALFVLLAASLATTMVMNPALRLRTTARPRVLLLDQGLVDWKPPSLERLGPFSLGMFGTLPKALGALGYEAARVPVEELPSMLSANPGAILVIINPSRRWSEAERDAIWTHVASGGGLLVLGDHTDVGRQMGSLNPLLAHIGVAFRFDSAYPFGRVFRGGEISRRSTLFRDLEADREVLVGIGASLDVRSPSRVELAGPRSHSDRGQIRNLSGSHLGNYYWSPGERLGDLALAARCLLGRGRVLVFGDTTFIQNGALYATLPGMIRRSMAWLAGADPERPLPPYILLWSLTLVLVVLLAPASPSAGWLGAAGVGVLAGVLLPIGCNWPRAHRSESLGNGVAVLDLTHGARTPGLDAQTRGLGHLRALLLRAGFLTIEELPGFSIEGVPRVQVIVEPSRPYGEPETNALLARVRSGATCLVFCSPNGATRLEHLLDACHGARIGPPALGPVPQRFAAPRMRSEPVFVDAHAISFSRPTGDEEVLYQFGEWTLAAAVRIGKGRVVLVGDGQFPRSRNLEPRRGLPHLGNIMFIRNLL